MRELTSAPSNRLAVASNNSDLSPFRVLVADNDEADRRLTISQLGKAWSVERDMIVECAADGIEALEMIRSNWYGLIVMNWNMTCQNGADLWRVVREHRVRVPVVVVSDQRHAAMARDLDSMAVGIVNKHEMDAARFRNAIVASILLQDGVLDLVRSGQMARVNAWLRSRKVRLARNLDSFRGPERGGKRSKKLLEGIDKGVLQKSNRTAYHYRQ